MHESNNERNSLGWRSLYNSGGGVALLIASYVMLRSHTFGKVTAYIGLLMGIMMVVSPTVGKVGLIFSLLSLPPTIIWLIVIAKVFFQLRQIIRQQKQKLI